VTPALVLLWTLTGHAPLYRAGLDRCSPDTTRAAAVASVIVYRVGHQAPAWRPGCAASVACWDSVRAQAAPQQVASVACSDGGAFAFTLPDSVGQVLVVARGSNMREVACWSALKVKP